MKKSLQQILEAKNKYKLVCLTAYSFPVAKIVDEFCDIILVGDSLGMTIYGDKDTLGVSLEMMINHGKAVVKARKKSFVVVDLPFNTYEASKEQALESAKKVIEQTNCDAVKIEITPKLIETSKYLVDNGINLMGHIGLLPQHVRELGGYKYQGLSENSAQEIIATAKELEKIGVFAIVIEAVPAKLADKITKEVKIPTIGIGASKNCDGQILVIDDLLGLNQEFTPKFVKKYANLANVISNSVQNYKNDVLEKKFPSKENEV
jgi:3-methyl-2-oxobutanoate hydroxymethyltransferase